MPDREKVIKGLEVCYCPPSKWEDCPYHDLPDEQSCNDVLCLDALALLKEQEAAKPKIGHWVFESAYYEAWSHTCSECGKRMTTAINTYANWCWNCGAKMEGR